MRVGSAIARTAHAPDEIDDRDDFRIRARRAAYAGREPSYHGGIEQEVSMGSVRWSQTFHLGRRRAGPEADEADPQHS